MCTQCSIPFAQKIEDWMIVVAVGIMVGIDVALLVIASAVPQLRIRAQVQTSTEYSVDSGVRP